MNGLLLASDLFRIANYMEAGLWFSLAAGVLAGGYRRWRTPSMVAGIALVAFGMSDIVEARTGAWWRPWWLLVWKSLCVLALVACLAAYARARRGGGRKR